MGVLVPSTSVLKQTKDICRTSRLEFNPANWEEPRRDPALGGGGGKLPSCTLFWQLIITIRYFFLILVLSLTFRQCAVVIQGMRNIDERK